MRARFTFAPVLFLCFLLVLLASTHAAADAAQPSAQSDNTMQPPLTIAAFKDITAFILETGQRRGLFNIDVAYVKNADEAHSDLTTRKRELVFMSYDDTLSLALQDKYADIEAVAPVHGGVLDLCGSLDLTRSKNLVGIDTDSGYARALRRYLRQRLPNQSDYAKISWAYAGATNLRYKKLVDEELQATLLNPPYSYGDGVTRLVKMLDVVGAYQGVVINANKSWRADANNAARLDAFRAAYYSLVNALKTDKTGTIAQLAAHYAISEQQAAAVYARLWEADGLSLGPTFSRKQLEGAEALFAWDTGVPVVSPRGWLGGALGEDGAQ